MKQFLNLWQDKLLKLFIDMLPSRRAVPACEDSELRTTKILGKQELKLVAYNVLHIIDTGGPGGAETIFFELSTRLDDQRWNSRPVVPCRDWLAKTWASRHPELPGLDGLLAEGRVLLLLDALNEMPAPSEKEFRARLQLWKAWLQQLAATRPGKSKKRG